MKKLAWAALRYAALLIVLVVAGLGAEYLAGLTPQERVMAHYRESVDQLEEEGFQPGVLNIYRADSRLNNYTETLILHYSAALNTRVSPVDVLRNRAVTPLNEYGPEAFYRALSGESTETQPYQYTRYWMGFRAVVRPLLAICNYSEMRRILLWAFALLACGCGLRLSKRAGRASAGLLFAVALLMMNPIVVSTSFQFGCCFLLGMAGVLWVTSVRRRAALPYVFFALGALTQYFDFYTAPSVTLCYPLLALLLWQAADPGESPLRALKLALACAAAWAAAYGAMWLCKLYLSQWLADDNTLYTAFQQFEFRVGLVRTERVEEYYSIPGAFVACFRVLGKTNAGLLGALFIAGCALALRRGARGAALGMGAVALGVGVVPLLWIAVAAQPSALHAYFQYRTLGGFCLALLYAPLCAAVRQDALARQQLKP